MSPPDRNLIAILEIMLYATAYQHQPNPVANISKFYDFVNIKKAAIITST